MLLSIIAEAVKTPSGARDVSRKRKPVAGI